MTSPISIRFKVFAHRTEQGMFGRIIENDYDLSLAIAPLPRPELFSTDATMEIFKSEYPELNFDQYELVEVEMKEVNNNLKN